MNAFWVGVLLLMMVFVIVVGVATLITAAVMCFLQGDKFSGWVVTGGLIFIGCFMIVAFLASHA